MRYIYILLIFLSILIPSATSSSHILDNAKWIGVPNTALPLYPDYLAVFILEFDFTLPQEGEIAIKYGQDDPRLLDKNLNIYNLENLKDQSYIKIAIDKDKALKVYRAGYHPNDNKDEPIAVFHPDNFRKDNNHLKIISNLGNTEFFLNDKKIGKAHLNPVGNGGDYIAFPVLAKISALFPVNSDGFISNIAIRNFREPGNVLFSHQGPVKENCSITIPERSMPELKGDFDINPFKNIKKATLYATSRGIYDLYLNGKRIFEDYFYPGATQYNKTHLYNTFDITDKLKRENNNILVRLAEGWWSGPHTFTGENWNFYGDRQSFIAKIIIEYQDGTISQFVTDTDNWNYRCDGPIVTGSFFNGEVYDASKEKNSTSVWKPVVEIGIDSTVNRSLGSWEDLQLIPSFGDKVSAIDTIVSKHLYMPRPGIYIYDMGQNMAGVPEIKFTNLHPGQQIVIRYAEMLYPDMPQYAQNKGMIMTENLRAAMVKDIFRAGESDEFTFSPRFTLHGFRYIEISGLREPLPLEHVKAIPLSSIHEIKAHYECSDTLVNRLWENIIWSAKSNFISIPTDCPQRNERLGWMGDISVFAPTATKIADISPLLKQYLQSVRDCQLENGRYPDVAPTGFGFGGLLWGSAGITVPWEYYLQYGDLSLLHEHYPSMKRYVEYILNHTIDPHSGIIVQNHSWGDLGDWLSPEYEKTDKSLLWDCYFIYDLEIMEKIAMIIGNMEDASYFAGLRAERTQHFIDTYVDTPSQKTVCSAFEKDKEGKIIDTQVSYALPIAMEIYQDHDFISNFLKTFERENLADDGTVAPPFSLMTGFIGTAWIMEALTKSGNSDIAYRLLTSRNYPSWLYPVTQGATTIWERLNSYTHKDGFGKNNSMNSFNHYSFGSVGNWLITRSLGINVDKANYKCIIAPEPDLSGSLSEAQGWLETGNGKVYSSWRIKDDNIIFQIEVPESGEYIFRFREKSEALSPGKNTITRKR